MPYNYKFPNDVKDEESEDILIGFLDGKVQESGSMVIIRPEDDYYRKIKYHFRKGVLSGMQYVFDENDNRVMSVQFVEGKRHGFYIKHHNNGVIACTGTYKNGDPIGIWKFYDQYGNHTSTHKY